MRGIRGERRHGIRQRCYWRGLSPWTIKRLCTLFLLPSSTLSRGPEHRNQPPQSRAIIWVREVPPPRLNPHHCCARFSAPMCGASPCLRGAVDYRRGGNAPLGDPEFLAGVEFSAELASYRGHHRPSVDSRYGAPRSVHLEFPHM
jgi:hypothetical protein